jgi:hypothetical protein
MSTNLEGRRWWVMAMVVLLGADTAATLADDAPPAAAPAAQVAPDRSADAIDRAVANLAHADPTTRDAAATRLLAIGKPARAALAAAAKGDDPEAAARAKALLARITVPLAITLNAPTTTIKPGQPLPPLTVEIRNALDAPFTVVRPLDGCDVGWRVARYDWALTGPDGDEVPRQPQGRCGTVNPLTADDFARLAPGEALTVVPGKTFLFAPAGHFAPAKPGTYRLTLRYSFDPARNDRPLGGRLTQGKIAETLSAIPPTDVTSNTLTIQVRE